MKHEILVYNKILRKTPKKFIVLTISKALNFLKLKQPAELAVLIVDKYEIKRLNKIWRGKDKVVDELSFGLNSRKATGLLAGKQIFAKKENSVLRLGEIVIKGDKISDKKYLATLLVHSLLHLLGHSHEHSAVKAKKMERLEKNIFKYLKV